MADALDGVFRFPGSVEVAVSDTSAPSSLSAIEANARIVRLTGTLTAARSVVFPAVEGDYIVENACTDAVTVKTSGAAGVSLAAGEIALVRCSGVTYARVGGASGGSSTPDVQTHTVTGDATLTSTEAAADLLVLDGTPGAEHAITFPTADTSRVGALITVLNDSDSGIEIFDHEGSDWGVAPGGTLTFQRAPAKLLLVSVAPTGGDSQVLRGNGLPGTVVDASVDSSSGLGLYLRTVRRVSPTGVAATDTAAIQAAVTAMAAVGGDVVLGAGTFVVDAAIEFDSNVRLRGAGIGKTIIESALTKDTSFNSVFMVNYRLYSTGSTTTTLSAAPVVGSSTISVASTLSGRIAAGQIIKVHGAPLGPRDLYGSTFKVKSVSGAGPYTVTLDRPIVFPLQANDEVVALAGQVSDVRISDLSITGRGGRAFEFIATHHCVVERVKWYGLDTGSADWMGAFDSFGHHNFFVDCEVDGGGNLPTGGLALEEQESSGFVRCYTHGILGNATGGLGAGSGLFVISGYGCIVDDCISSGNVYGALIGDSSATLTGAPPLFTKVRGGRYESNQMYGITLGQDGKRTHICGVVARDNTSANIFVSAGSTFTLVDLCDLGADDLGSSTPATANGIYIDAANAGVVLRDNDTSGAKCGVLVNNGATTVIDGHTHTGMANTVNFFGIYVSQNAVVTASRLALTSSFVGVAAYVGATVRISDSDIGASASWAIYSRATRVSIFTSTIRGTQTIVNSDDSTSQIYLGEQVTLVGATTYLNRANVGEFTATGTTQVDVTGGFPADARISFNLKTVGGTPAQPYFSAAAAAGHFYVKSSAGDTSTYRWRATY